MIAAILIFLLVIICIFILCKNNFMYWKEEDQMIKNLLSKENDFSLYTREELFNLKEQLKKYLTKIDFISAVDYELTEALINQVEIEIDLRKINGKKDGK